MCECSSHISRLESEIGRLRADQQSHDAWHARRARDWVAHEIFLSGLALGALQLFCGTFLFATAMLADGAVRHAWVPAVPLMAGGAALIVCAGLGVFAPAKSLN